MAATILDGKAVSAKIRAALAAQTAGLSRKPGLAVVLVGRDPASELYVSNKEKACREIGYLSRKIVLPETAGEDEVLSTVRQLNADPAIDGILVQFPLPDALSGTEEKIIRLIDPAKDVDGFHPANVGEFVTVKRKPDAGMLLPCTPAGVMRILADYRIPIAGKHAVVLGRSNLVGKPVALLLLAEDATVTVCHSKTPNLLAVTRSADILVTAIGRPKFVTADMVGSGAVVVDVGINRTDDGTVGDVDYAAVSAKASAITPVPGGIGPMTIAMLMDNVMKAYRKREGLPPVPAQP
jgi:methylenetetrahydrofolate dehydrogenase (NADP+)/methenyltetrahydrofolate cyclohydrolase